MEYAPGRPYLSLNKKYAPMISRGVLFKGFLR